MNRFLACLAALFLSAAAARAEALDSILSVENQWAQKQDDFMSSAKSLGFEWTSSAHDSARAARPGMTTLGLPTVEALARFGDDALKEMTIVLYARGDVGDWAEDKFDALVRTAAEALNKHTTAKFSVRGKDPTSPVKSEALVWNTERARYVLEYSKTKEMKTRGIPFRAEFVRLEVFPPEKKSGLLSGATAAAKTKFSGASHLKKDAASGDVWINDVPMVDQGQKGYCVVASTERVMRYYGNAVDQQELAQAANTQTDGGTSYTAMFEALKKLSARLKMRVREVEKSDIRDILKMIAEYNRAAKKSGAPLIPEQRQIIDLGEIYNTMDVAVLKEMRTKNKADLNRFQRTVQAHINEGTPLLWTVMLGKVPEPGIPQNAGGHMRLIIGYNTKGEEILYTDSWGAGHELKRMPSADAWTITTGAMSIEPF